MGPMKDDSIDPPIGRVASVVQAVHDGEPLHASIGIPSAAIDALEQQAYRLYRAGRLEETETMSRGIAALDATRPYPRLLLGDVSAQRQDWETALADFETALTLDASLGIAAFKCGEVLAHLERFEEAADMLECALESSNSAPPGWVARAEGLLERVESRQTQQQNARE